MRYALLDYLACPECLAPLLCLTTSEIPSPMPVGRSSGGTRVGSGAGFGPLPAEWPCDAVTATLAAHATAAAEPARGDGCEVASGLLLCACGRWFPIHDTIPELLPDHLRTLARDHALVRDAYDALPADVRGVADAFDPPPDAHADAGVHYKRAEIGIQEKVDEPLFFVPGESSPFAYWDSDFSVYLIKLFGVAAPLLRVARGEPLLDSGCGYAWTTEWLFRSGFDPIGVDICRTYLDVALRRLTPPRPHLVRGDVESLPLRSRSVRAVLAYESFHHIPDRPRAMREFERVMAADGRIVLAEPGEAHEAAPASVHAMAKYGILERGMELEDVRGYVGDTDLVAEQIFLVRLQPTQFGTPVDAAFARAHSIVEGNLFRIERPAPSPPQPPADAAAARPHLIRRVGRRVRAMLGA